MDIVKTFNELSGKLGYKFSYGTDDILNLIDLGIDDGFTLMLQSPLKVNQVKDNLGTTIKTKVNGGIIFGTSSSLEDAIYNENDGKITDTQYNKHVVRLIAEIENIENEFLSCGVIFEKLDYYEVYNLFDTNITALIIDFTIAYE